MTDFELQRRLRELIAPRPPQGDLWPAIAARIATAPVRVQTGRRRSAWLPIAAAAALLFAIAGTLSIALRQHDAMPDNTMMANAIPPRGLPVSPHDVATFANAPNGDPRLIGAAAVLDAAHAELEQALDQRPDAVFLVSLLNRTRARRTHLDQFGAGAGAG
jgi:hypothetical protein